MRYSLMGGTVHDIAASRRNPAGGPGHGRAREPGSGTPGPVHHVVRRTRIGGTWVAAALFAVVLLLPLIFILENSQSMSTGYFGTHGHLPLGVALLLAAVLGVLLVVIPGTAHHPAPHHRTPSPPPRHHDTGLARRHTGRRPRPPPGSRRPGQPCRHVRAKTPPPGRRTDSARTPVARRFRLDLPPACDGALTIVLVPVRLDVDVFERSADGDTASAGTHRLRRIQALDQHIGLGMRQRLLPLARTVRTARHRGTAAHLTGPLGRVRRVRAAAARAPPG